MPNHFHLLIRQKSEGTITKFMLRLCTSYSKYFNVKYELVGRLFQERFKAKIVETDEYLLQLSRYVHLNPISDDLEELKFQLGLTPGVEANKMHQKLISYPWSSYKEYVEGIKGICDKKFLLDYFSKQQPNKSYASFVEAGTTEQEQQLLTPFL